MKVTWASYLLLCWKRVLKKKLRQSQISPNQSKLIYIYQSYIYISFIYLNHVSELATFWGDILILQLKNNLKPHTSLNGLIFVGSFSEWIRKLLSLISMSGLRKNPGGSWTTESEGIAMHRCSRRRSCTEASGSNFTCYSPISESQKSLENGYKVGPPSYKLAYKPH